MKNWFTQIQKEPAVFGVCLSAFSICPLGGITMEVAGITINLPEIIILFVCGLVLISFIRRGEHIVPELPWQTLSLCAAAAGLALYTAVHRHNGTINMLQDFRQFTEYALLFVIVLQRVRTVEHARYVACSYLAGCSLIAIHGIVQRYTGIGIPPGQLASDIAFYGVWRSGSFYGATPLGGLMTLACGTAMSVILSARHRYAQWGWMIALALCLTAAVFTHARTAWVAILIMFIFVLASVRWTPQLIAGFLLGILLFAVSFGSTVQHRLDLAAQPQQSVIERQQYYTAAWHIFRANPLTGLGWGPTYSVPDILEQGRYVPHTVADGEHRAWTCTVHSAYLQLLIKTGLAGLLAFLAFLAQWWWGIWRERKQYYHSEAAAHLLFVGITGGLLGYLCQISLENYFQWPVMAQSFWLLMGLSTMLQMRHANQ